MKAIHKRTLLLTSLVILLPMFVGLALWNRLPERMPTHFGFSGAPDGYSGRLFAVVGLPLFILAVQLICTLALRADPKKQNLSPKLTQLTLWICPAVSLFMGIAIDLNALGMAFDVGCFASIFIGLIFVVIGNYLPKCRPNYTMGIRVPWTLASEENWYHTHRFGGYVFLAVGLAAMVSSFFGGMREGLIALLLVASFSPIVYSYGYAKKHGQI